MSSPVSIHFSNFIQLDKNAKPAIYLQLAQQLVNAIQRGYLMPGSKIPGSRILAKELNLHRQTVIAALNDLQQQGWITVTPNKGTFVVEADTLSQVNTLRSKAHQQTSASEKPRFHFEQSILLDPPFEEANARLIGNDGLPDLRLSPLNNLSSLYSSSLKRKGMRKIMSENPSVSHQALKEQLANYLNASRGLAAGANRLFISRNTETPLYILSRLLIKKNDIVVVARLSYATANMSFQQAGAQILTIGLDQDGIIVDDLAALLKIHQVRLVYITPHQHYPTTARLSVQRRLQLLQLLQQHDFIVVEDDYDFDFQYERNTVLPLASADTTGRVIYLGSFGKWLAPAFSIGFVLAPQPLILEMEKYNGLIDRQGDPIMSQVLAEMISEGDIHRHLKKSLQVYKQRRNTASSLLSTYFDKSVSFREPNGGLAFWLVFQPEVSLYQLSNRCKKNGLIIPKYLMYRNKEINALRFGFAHFNEAEMQESLQIMQTELQSFY
jgi:GntR family transcriptional regulator/MocR family aminotransferase